MIKYLLGFAIVCTIACDSESKINIHPDEIWIPESRNWENGNFNTFYFLNDSTFTLVSSTQSQLNDSINFQAEPGFILRQGTVIKQNPHELEITYRVLYRFITLPGDTTPSKLTKAKLDFNRQDKKSACFEYEGIKYSKTSKYTNQSVKTIRSIAKKMVPDLKKEFGLD